MPQNAKKQQGMNDATAKGFIHIDRTHFVFKNVRCRVLGSGKCKV